MSGILQSFHSLLTAATFCGDPEQNPGASDSRSDLGQEFLTLTRRLGREVSEPFQKIGRDPLRLLPDLGPWHLGSTTLAYDDTNRRAEIVGTPWKGLAFQTFVPVTRPRLSEGFIAYNSRDGDHEFNAHGERSPDGSLYFKLRDHTDSRDLGLEIRIKKERKELLSKGCIDGDYFTVQWEGAIVQQRGEPLFYHAHISLTPPHIDGPLCWRSSLEVFSGPDSAPQLFGSFGVESFGPQHGFRGDLAWNDGELSGNLLGVRHFRGGHFLYGMRAQEDDVSLIMKLIWLR